MFVELRTVVSAKLWHLTYFYCAPEFSSVLNQ